jgi:hypothetical protein
MFNVLAISKVTKEKLMNLYTAKGVFCANLLFFFLGTSWCIADTKEQSINIKLGSCAIKKITVTQQTKNQAITKYKYTKTFSLEARGEGFLFASGNINISREVVLRCFSLFSSYIYSTIEFTA